MGLERFIPRAENEAIDAATGALVAFPLGVVGPPLEVVFPAAATRRDIPHGLGVVPDGVFVVLQSGGVVTATDVHLWTPNVAWLMASAVNTRARLIFYTLTKGAIIHVVP